mgnify:CR=1 FL=1
MREQNMTTTLTRWNPDPDELAERIYETVRSLWQTCDPESVTLLQLVDELEERLEADDLFLACDDATIELLGEALKLLLKEKKICVGGVDHLEEDFQTKWPMLVTPGETLRLPAPPKQLAAPTN